MDCSTSLDNLHDSSTEFAHSVGDYIDGYNDASIGGIVDHGIAYASDYLVVDLSCGHDIADPADPGATTNQ